MYIYIYIYIPPYIGLLFSLVTEPPTLAAAKCSLELLHMLEDAVLRGIRLSNATCSDTEVLQTWRTFLANSGYP